MLVPGGTGVCQLILLILCVHAKFGSCYMNSASWGFFASTMPSEIIYLLSLYFTPVCACSSLHSHYRFVLFLFGVRSRDKGGEQVSNPYLQNSLFSQGKTKTSPKSLWAFPVSKLSVLLNQKKKQKYKLSNPSAQKGQVYQINSIYYCLDRRCTKGKEMDFSLSNQHMYRLKICCPNSFGLNCTSSHQRNTCFAELIQIFTLIQKASVGNGRIEGQNPGSA